MSVLSTWGNSLYTGKVSYPFIARRRLWYMVAAVLILISFTGLFGRGINFGIEFRGGTEIRVAQVADMENYESRATETLSEAAPEAVTITATRIGDNTVRLQTGELTNQRAEEAREALAAEFAVPLEEVSSNLIGPSWGETVTNKAIQALVVFLILVTLVLALYFRTWKMAVASLVALVHDVIFTVGIYALLGIEVSPASMIGFLTILGYSIYDTIVVFDKVRENTEHAMETRRMTFGEAANLAVNQTLVRSITTSIVALLPIAVIMLFGIFLIGPGTLLDLSVALFIGITVGAFSSVFVAPAVLVDLRKGEKDIAELDRKVAKRRSEHPEPEAVVEEAELDPTGGAAVVAESMDQPVPATRTVASEEQAAGGRQLHPYAQRGPRNQPRRKPKR